MNMSVSDPAPRGARLDMAFEAGLTLPDTAPIAVFHPRAGEVLSALPRDQIHVISPYATDLKAFASFKTASESEGRYGAALICLPREKAAAQAMIAHAAAITDGPVLIDGQKTDGIEPMLRALRKRVDLSEAISKGHGKLAWFSAPAAEALTDWQAGPQSVTAADGRAFQTAPGVFSADGVDAASALLAEHLPATLKGRVADLGAGWGYLSAVLLAKAPDLKAVHLIENDKRALDCARANIDDPRAHFHWADATQPLLGEPEWVGQPAPRLMVDAVIMNPPFHVGRETRPQLGAGFIRAAANMLKPNGQLWLVANRHLPYEPVLAECFKAHSEIAGTTGFKILHAEGILKSTSGAPAARRTRVIPSKGRRG